MSQPSRRHLAVVLLTVLAVAHPAPSRAQGFTEPDWAVRAWSWLESRGLVPPGPKPPRVRFATPRFAKDGTTTGTVVQQPQPVPGNGQGSGIDPNGGTR